MKPLVSIVIPFFNEEESLRILYKELKEVLVIHKIRHEIIFVNDGSSDDGLSQIKTLLGDKTVKLVTYSARQGKSHALTKGFVASSGEYIIQLDADLQDDPKYIPAFLKELQDSDMVVGTRIKRSDGLTREIGSKVFNRMTNLISKTKLSDHNSGFKGYKKRTIKNINLSKGMHRYITSLVAYKGYKISEIKVVNRKRIYGKSKYGTGRIIEAIGGFIKLINMQSK